MNFCLSAELKTGSVMKHDFACRCWLFPFSAPTQAYLCNFSGQWLKHRKTQSKFNTANAKGKSTPWREREKNRFFIPVETFNKFNLVRLSCLKVSPFNLFNLVNIEGKFDKSVIVFLLQNRVQGYRSWLDNFLEFIWENKLRNLWFFSTHCLCSTDEANGIYHHRNSIYHCTKTHECLSFVWSPDLGYATTASNFIISFAKVSGKAVFCGRCFVCTNMVEITYIFCCSGWRRVNIHIRLHGAHYFLFNCPPIPTLSVTLSVLSFALHFFCILIISIS